uniref:Ig-like domain-containing protein n=1 Tax=Myripristis murdjan TaxID=586833 RepID=A0A667ZZG0_9TELE
MFTPARSFEMRTHFLVSLVNVLSLMLLFNMRVYQLLAPVVFKKELESQDALEGGKATLSCEISSPDGKVTWRKGPTVLTQGEKYSMEHRGSIQILVVHKLNAEDSGEYTCDTGDKQSTATLTISCSHFRAYLKLSDVSDYLLSSYPAAPVFLTELQSQDVPDGYPVSFDCVVIGKPPPSVRWFKDGKLLEENDHYMINEDQEGCHQLIITSVLPSDMGVYRCMAENSSGIAATKAELRVDSE